MNNIVAFFHSTMNTPNTIRKAFEKRFPDAQLINVVDDSILPEIVANHNQHTPNIVRKLVSFAASMQHQGAAVAVCTCTTLAGAVEEASKAIDIPFISVDAPMMAQAVRGDRIAVLITASTTEDASRKAAESAAECANRQVAIDVRIVEGAFHALNVEKDQRKHDLLIEEEIRAIADDYDTIVLAQITMAHIAQFVNDVPTLVLSSLDSGIEYLANWITP